jgi:hypothetical protein
MGFTKEQITERYKTKFIERSKIRHGGQFAYTGVYVNRSTPIEVVCLDHGSFITTPHLHQYSKYGGCKECYRLGQPKNRVRSIEERRGVFIE